jgi:uncharacterized protein (DUF488 family)
MKLYTIGFSEKSAEDFFGLLEDNGVKKIIDTRVLPSTETDGFAKGEDLAYLARKMLDIDYEHHLSYAPTLDLLSRIHEGAVSWDGYVVEYHHLIAEREILKDLEISAFDQACLLCFEHQPDQCHRRLLAEYIQKAFPEVEIVHLVD